MRSTAVHSVGAEVVVRLQEHFVDYQPESWLFDIHVFPRYRATTGSLRRLEFEATRFAAQYGLSVGLATAVIMTGRLPEARGRSIDDDDLDSFLKDVLREMRESGHTLPGPGQPGRDTGVRVFWEEAMRLFNEAVSQVPRLAERTAGSWRTVRSRFEALCRRYPEFREEIGGSDGREEQA